MLIIATFRHSAYLELALQMLEQNGFSKGSVLAAPLQKPSRDARSDLYLVHKDGKSPYDLAFIFAMVFMLLGAIYGFVLAWGPIIWSVIGLVVGAIFGLLLDVFMGKKPFKARADDSEVVLMISCAKDQTKTVEDILCKHQALGISKIANYR